MRLFILPIILVLPFASVAQHHLNCNELQSIQVTLSVNLAGQPRIKYISKSELAKADLKIYLENSNHKIFGFVASYDCHSGIYYDLNSKHYLGNKIPAGDIFLDDLQIGDIITLDCFVLEKNEKRVTTTGILFEVVD